MSTPYQRGYESGLRDSGKRYNGGQGSGYTLSADRHAFMAGYEEGWNENLSETKTPAADDASDGRKCDGEIAMTPPR